MKKLPQTENALLLRTCFSDDAAWAALCAAALQTNEDDFQASLDCVSDREFEGLTVEKLLGIAEESEHSFVFLADQFALSHHEHPIRVVDLDEALGCTFRVIPREMWNVENNLSLANMDFRDFAESIEADGIFRGFE